MSAPLLRLSRIVQQYGAGETAVRALDGIDLEVQPGELVAVMGASGSGKSSLLSIAGGLAKPTSGTVEVDGVDIAALSPKRIAALRRTTLGFVFQDYNLVPTLTAIENVGLPLELDGWPRGKTRRAALDALAAVELTEQAGRYPDDLSGGQQQRVAIARAVVGPRRLILADEPTGALDSHTGEIVLRMLRARIDSGAGGVLVTHDARHAAWADRIVFLRDGRVADQAAASPPGVAAHGRALMRGTRNRWVVALKIARRSALTSWSRSLLIVALIAAPIIGLSAAAVVLPSRQSTPAERVQGTLGHAQAVLHVVAGPGDKIEQTIEADGYSSNSGAMAGSSADDRRVDPRTVLPAGTRLIATGYDAATFARGSGAVSLAVETGETWDPSLDGGPYVLLSGRRPSTADEVLVSPAALARLGAHVGGTITMTTPTTRTLTVVGTSRDRAQPSSAQTVFAASSALPETDVPLDSVTFYVPSLPIDWAMVRRLNAIGTTVFSRQVVLDPVPPSTGASMGDGGSAAASTAVVIALALVFALLEVALLAGSAFLVGARLQQRTLAIIASVGADRSVLRRVVTANGVVLGAIGGVAGVGLGIVAALVVMRLTDDGAWTRYPGVHIVWPVLAGIVAFGVLVGWLAALVPARAAARFDVVRALRGARTPQSVGKKPVLGVVLLAVGVALTILGSGALVAALKVTGPWETAAQLGAVALLGGGPVVAQIGVLLCAGLVLRGVARLLARGPLPGRLAARDTSRNLGRAVPAVASVMTTLFVASFAMCIANTASIDSSRYYSWTAAEEGHGVALIASSTTGPPSDADARRWVDTLSYDLPITSTAVLATTPQGSSDAHPSNRARDAQAIVHFPERPGSCTEQQLMDLGDLRCGPFTSSGGSSTNAQNAITIGNEAGLTALLGHSPSAEALAALQHGGAVGLRSDLAPRGTATLEWFTPKQLMEFSAAQHPKRSAHVETVVDLPAHPLQDALFMTPATAKTLGIEFAPYQALLSFARTPTQSELDSANAALDALANSPDGTFVTIENGPQDFGSQIAWYVLLACLIIAISAGATAVGLARVDGRADDLTLASLGASPRIRRSVAFAQGLIVCGVGAVIGTALGLLPAVAISAASVSYAFAPPVLQLVLTALGIPLVIAVGSYLLVGTRKADLTRRTAIA